MSTTLWGAALVVAVVLLVGASLGSCAALVATRLPQQRSLWRPRSHCDSCGAPVAYADLFPLVSYLWLKGRCRRCRAPIALRAPCSEALMAALALALWWRLETPLAAMAWWVLAAILWAIALIDIDTWWIPDVLLLAALPWALAVAPWREGPGAVALGMMPAALLWAVGMAVGRLRQQEALGLGDVKMLALLGLSLGLPKAMAVATLAAAQGALVALVLRVVGGHPPPPLAAPLPAALVEDGDWQPPAHALPFAPFLLLGCLQVLLFPQLQSLWLLP